MKPDCIFPDDSMRWHQWNRRNILRKFYSVIIGNFLCAAALLLFLRPGEMIGGGIGGISVLLNAVTGIPVGLTVFLLNLPLIVLGLFYLDRSFIFFSTVSIFLFSGYLSLFEVLSTRITVTQDVLLSCIFGGVINGLGMGIMFRNGTCQGGLDIVAAFCRKKWGIQIGSALLTVNGIIITISARIYSLDRALYTLVALFVAYQVLDKIQMGVGRQKQVFILSDHDEEITRYIQQRLHRGVTYLKGMGAYSHHPIKVIYCITSTQQFVQLRRNVKNIDPDAFIAVSETVEVQGRGFKKMEV